MNIPYVPLALVLALEERFKPTPIAPGVTIEDALYQSGKCALVRFLRETHEQQEREQVPDDNFIREPKRNVHQPTQAAKDSSPSPDPSTTPAS